MGAIPPSPAASEHAPEGWSWPASEQPSPLPGRRRRAAVVVVVAALVLPATWWAWARLGGPADGALTYPAAGWRGDGVPVAWVIGPPSGLCPGDLVVAVDGRSLESWVGGDSQALTRKVGDQLFYQVLRDGRPIVVPVTLRDYPLAAALVSGWAALLLYLTFAAVACFVFLHRPADPAARVLLALAALVPIGATTWPFGLQVVDLVGGRGVWPFVVGDIANALVWAALLHLALLVPTPLPAVARRGWLPAVGYVLPFVLQAGYLAVTLPGASSNLERLGRLAPVSHAAARTYPVLIAVTMVVQYRAARDRATRQRLRWVLITFLVAVSLYVGLRPILDAVPGHPRGPLGWRALVFLPCPLALAIAVMRHRLFGIEVIVKRSLVYGSLTVCALALYAATIGLASALFGGRLDLASLVAAGLVAVCFQPLRDRLQRSVSRLVYGERDDPYEVIFRLGERLQSAAAPEAILPGVVATLAHALRLRYAAIQLYRTDGSLQTAASFGELTGEPLSLPLSYQGELVGRLLLDVGPDGAQFGPADHRLLEGLARQVGAAAHAVRLTVELQRSRERLVTAREEERRRLRRDLHDGLGPTLASSVMQLEVARRLVHTDPSAAEALLGRLTTQTTDCLADIRRLVDGLRPPALDQLGLVSALKERATTFVRIGPDSRPLGPFHVTFEADGDLQALPAAVEVAAFWIALEALSNASRHGHARSCRVRFKVNGALQLEVRDDGRGLPARYTPGVGLPSMRERAAELGGTCTIKPAPDGGTVVSAWLPLPQE